MEPQSPPKRVTRARAAKTTTAPSTTKAAAPKASTTKTAAAKSTAAKDTAAKPVTAKEAPARPSAAKEAPAKPSTVKSSTGDTASTAAKRVTKAAAPAPAPTTRAAPTTRTAPSTKRKTRCDDENDEESQNAADELAPTSADTANKPTARGRGRPKKTAAGSASQPEPEATEEAAPAVPGGATAARASRGRAKKQVDDAPKPEEEAPKPDPPAKATRARATRKAAQPQEEKSEEPPKKKVARGRAPKKMGTVCVEATTEPTPGLKTALSRPTTKISASKKSVSFEEPEKENVLPPAATKTKAKSKDKTEDATGLKARPVRKPAAGGRTTRASATAKADEPAEEKKEKPAPLSPKKDSVNRSLSHDSDSSDDELATYEKTPLKALKKSPVRPPSAGMKKLDLGFSDKEETSEQGAAQSDEPTGVFIFGSPTRRPAPSPFKDSLKSPAKRADKVPSLIFPSANGGDEAPQSASKTMILQSPAKRPQVPLGRFQLPDGSGSGKSKSPMKMSLFSSPAKRPMSPFKLPGAPAPSVDHKDQAPGSPTNDRTTPEAEESDDDDKMDEDVVVAEVSEEASPQIVEESTKESTPESTLKPIKIAAEESAEESGDESIDESADEDADEYIEKQIEEPVEGHIEEQIEELAEEQIGERVEQPVEQHAEEHIEEHVEVRGEEPAAKSAEEPVVSKVTIAEDVKIAEDVEMAARNEVMMLQHFETEINLQSPEQLQFPGRLSAVLPRSADPALMDNSPVAEDEAAAQAESVAAEIAPVDEEMQDDPMDVDDDKEDEAHDISPESSPPRSAVRSSKANFSLPQKDLEPADLESEDELAGSGNEMDKFQDDTLTLNAGLSTPTPGVKTPRATLPTSALKAADRAIRSVGRNSKLGFTPLARQLNDWKTGSPLKQSTVQATPASKEADGDDNSLIESDTSTVAPTPGKPSYFDDEMKVRTEMERDFGSEPAQSKQEVAEEVEEEEEEFDADEEMLAALEADIGADYDEPEMDDIPLTHEDIDLAAEADEMSTMEPEQASTARESQNHDDSISDSSQEYGDENAVPIDPAILGVPGRSASSVAPPVTPVRSAPKRTFNTTTKVPLKPSDDSTPRTLKIKKRSASVSRVPTQRPSRPARNATVISYSPTKDTKELDADAMDVDTEPVEQVMEPDADFWSAMGSPNRTPRKDVDNGMLRGAVCYVDVYTSEGADASAVFIDLLSQMGARCVKSWPWNPNQGESAHSKIGITHVVFKDGGKRTMEKVRESGGVVQCVGVGWVLDCERENQWLDEAPYYIDTSFVPRGGHRRRKSMEPKALANNNGTLVTPMKQSAAAPREPQTAPNNHIGRRDSSVWMRTPSDRGDDEDADAVGEDDWDAGMLTPVPKTPAPETIARYAMEVGPETPARSDYADELALDDEELLLRTAPPKQSAYVQLGQDVLGQKKDQGVMMRLMAARRKSLQFAPKIASPLKRAWE